MAGNGTLFKALRSVRWSDAAIFALRAIAKNLQIKIVAHTDEAIVFCQVEICLENLLFKQTKRKLTKLVKKLK